MADRARNAGLQHGVHAYAVPAGARRRPLDEERHRIAGGRRRRSDAHQAHQDRLADWQRVLSAVEDADGSRRRRDSQQRHVLHARSRRTPMSAGASWSASGPPTSSTSKTAPSCATASCSRPTIAAPSAATRSRRTTSSTTQFAVFAGFSYDSFFASDFVSFLRGTAALHQSGAARSDRRPRMAGRHPGRARSPAWDQLQRQLRAHHRPGRDRRRSPALRTHELPVRDGVALLRFPAAGAA